MEQKNKKKILVVDDELSVLEIYNAALSEAGFEVVTAADGEEGLQKTALEKPDLILLDISMPVMDGLTMMQKLREKDDYGRKVPVVLLTNLSAGNEEIIKKVAQTEPVYYITKSSVTIQEVVKKVEDCLASI